VVEFYEFLNFNGRLKLDLIAGLRGDWFVF